MTTVQELATLRSYVDARADHLSHMIDDQTAAKHALAGAVQRSRTTGDMDEVTRLERDVQYAEGDVETAARDHEDAQTRLADAERQSVQSFEDYATPELHEAADPVGYLERVLEGARRSLGAAQRRRNEVTCTEEVDDADEAIALARAYVEETEERLAELGATEETTTRQEQTTQAAIGRWNQEQMQRAETEAYEVEEREREVAMSLSQMADDVREMATRVRALGDELDRETTMAPSFTLTRTKMVLALASLKRAATSLGEAESAVG